MYHCSLLLNKHSTQTHRACISDNTNLSIFVIVCQ